MDKKGAIEFSMTTIIIVVLSVTILIFAGIFVKKIMCSGIVMTDKITKGVEDEIINLFGTNDYGVKCQGEDGQIVKFGDGGRRQIACMINTDEQAEYEIKLISLTSQKGASTSTIQKWILNQDFSGNVAPGKKSVSVVLLDIPKQTTNTVLKAEIEVTNVETDTTETHYSIIDVVHVSGITSAVC
jgi:hypothetical protein